jgi:hypothetical protein
MKTSDSLHLVDVFRIDFRTSIEGDELNTGLQKALGLDYRYQPARIAIGLSLGNPFSPPAPANVLGKPIRGETLFGQEEADLAWWVALLIEHAEADNPCRRILVSLVAAHWLRGVQLLSNDIAKAHLPADQFLAQIAKREGTLGTVGGDT